jgi:hypothetical protein|tara:strand:+ start:1650 stop:1964 length:315 start_codon:yes stop_codon:yes gene_type:complete
MINGYLMWVGKQNDLLAGLEKREYFHASPFVGEDDQADWKNYGGIWWDNDVQADWVEDGRGLTEKQATAAAAVLNVVALLKSWDHLDDVDFELVGNIVHQFWKE